MFAGAMFKEHLPAKLLGKFQPCRYIAANGINPPLKGFSPLFMPLPTFSVRLASPRKRREIWPLPTNSPNYGEPVRGPFRCVSLLCRAYSLSQPNHARLSMVLRNLQIQPLAPQARSSCS